MLRATLKSLLARKVRLILSGLAVVLGVMFVSGAFVVTDTLSRSFDAVFQVLAQTVIQTAKAECTFELPKVEEPQVLDLPSVNLEVRRSPDAESQTFDQVAGRIDCNDAHSFYIHDRIELCPQACQWLQRAPEPAVEILYGCSVNPG